MHLRLTNLENQGIKFDIFRPNDELVHIKTC